MKFVVLSVLFAVILGCTGPNIIKQGSLIPIETPIAHIVVEKDLEFPASRSGALAIILNAGEYSPIGMDENGVFFLGPKYCMRYTRTDNNTNINYHCGIFVANDNDIWNVFRFGEERFTGETPHIPELWAVGDKLTRKWIVEFANANFFIIPKPNIKKHISYSFK